MLWTSRSWCVRKRMFENYLLRFVVTVNNHISLAKEKLIKRVECMNDSQSLFQFGHFFVLLG